MRTFLRKEFSNVLLEEVLSFDQRGYQSFQYLQSHLKQTYCLQLIVFVQRINQLNLDLKNLAGRHPYEYYNIQISNNKFKVIKTRSISVRKIIRMMDSRAGSKKIGDFIVGKTIGSGTFGKVKEGVHMPSGHKVAIKILEKGRINIRDDLARVHNELKILYKKVDHPNIIKLLELHESSTHVYIITEFIEGQELYELIVQKGSLDPHLCGIYFCQILQAIQYLHSIGVCHRDIKPENIMVNGSSLKLIDFGLSRQFGTDCLLKTSCGSPCYAAPQMLKGGSYNCMKSDIWAMGVTLYAMAAGHLPFEHENTDRLYELIETQALQPIISMPQNSQFSKTNSLSPYILSHPTSISLINLLLEKILRKDPDQRISTNQMNENMWVKQWQSYLRNNQSQYESDQILLNSMSEYFQKSVSQIQEILKSKSIMSICTYYFLNRKKKMVILDQNLNVLGSPDDSALREQKDKKLGTPVKQTILYNPESNSKTPHRILQKQDANFSIKSPKENTIQNKLKSQFTFSLHPSIITQSILNQSNSKYTQPNLKNNSKLQHKPIIPTNSSEEPEVHSGFFHVGLVFSTLQQVYQHINNELAGKFQSINNKIEEEDDQDEEDSQENDDGYLPKYQEEIIGQMEGEVEEEEEYICWNNKYILKSSSKKVPKPMRTILKQTICGVKEQKIGEIKSDVVYINKYTIQFKGVRMKIKMIQNSRLYYLEMPSYFIG